MNLTALKTSQKKLSQKSIYDIAQSLENASLKWMDKKYPLRVKAVTALGKHCGYPVVMAQEILDDLFSELTVKNIKLFLKTELGNPLLLDKKLLGPGIITHIVSGNVPNPSVMSVVFGLLSKSANIIKLSSEDSGLLELFLESLKKQDKVLASACEVITSEDKKTLDAAIKVSGAVIVYGSDETVNLFRSKLHSKQIFMEYGHRMSFSFYMESPILQLAKATAKDLWLMHQNGCLSPLIIYTTALRVESHRFCEELAKQLDSLDASLGKHPGSAGSAAAKLEMIKNRNFSLWTAQKGDLWQIFYDESPLNLPKTMAGRNIYIKFVKDLDQALESIKLFRRYAQAAALECSEEDFQHHVMKLGEFGFNRICQAGRLQKPPLCWPHDGRPNLKPLLRCADVQK